MASQSPSSGGDAAPDAAARDPAPGARSLMRSALKASLATLDRATGHPYASLVIVATEPAGAPLLLISRLALHTRNLEADSRAALLLDGTGGRGDPLTGGRVTLMGRMQLLDPAGPRTAAARRRFLSRHPAAGMYADFGDFAFWVLAVERGHFVGGFGRIHDLPASALLTDVAEASALLACEPEIVEHMNADHRDALDLYANRLLGAPGSGWRCTGVDPAGLDLVREDRGLRLEFPAQVKGPGEIRRCLADLARRARDGWGPLPHRP